MKEFSKKGKDENERHELTKEKECALLFLVFFSLSFSTW